MSKRVAIYLRVSTGEQNTENQRPEVEALATARGDIVAEYVETGSAAKKRPEFERMLKDAKRGKFDVVCIWSIDRFGRNTIGNQLDVVTLDNAGVQLVSVRESWLDTTGPTRALLVAIFSWSAEQERTRLIERTRAGMARVKKHGSKSGRLIGRPKTRFDLSRAQELLANGSSQRATAAELGVTLSVLQRRLAS
jgi:DNA invertase Pin-like site-specific DNA recombinase